MNYGETFDPYRYALDDTSWSSSESGKAIYYGDMLQQAIEKDEIRTVYVKFKVNDTAISELLTDNMTQQADDVPTMAIAKTYHKYQRRDYNWKHDEIEKEEDYTNEFNKSIYDHESKYDRKQAQAPILNLAVEENPRKISGITFKDTKVINALGNGEYDILTDGKVENVKIELLNKVDEKYQKANLYTVDVTGNPVETASESYSNQDGVYEITGIIPGDYVIRYTYGDGDQIIKDVDGNTITGISSEEYKSTIATEPNTVKALKGEDIQDGKWYLNIPSDLRPSVALDILEETKLVSIGDDYKVYSKEELDAGTTENKNIAADTAKVSVGIEWSKDNVGNIVDTNYDSNFSNMNFGIIEKPITKLDIDQVIKETRITLINGMNVIDWKQDQNVKNVIEIKKNTDILVQLQKEYIYGSTLEIKYLITVTNNSELNYNTSDYYWFGEKGTTEENKIEIKNLYDYLDPMLTYLETENGVSTDIINYTGQNDIKDLVDNIEDELLNSTYTTKRDYSVILDFQNVGEIYSTEGEQIDTKKEIEFTARATLSLDNDIDFLNIAQVTKIDSNAPIVNRYDSANINPISNIVSTAVIIPTGEDKNTIKYVYILIGTVILMLSFIYIKKKK